MAIKLPKSLLWISESTVEALLKFYDYPHPKKTGEIIEGYDKTHALRSAKMCAAVATYLGYDKEIVREELSNKPIIFSVGLARARPPTP